MDIKDNENESNDGDNNFEHLKIPLNLNEEKYLLKIFKSDDDVTIIFKLEKEKIQTYYYLEKFDLRDFRQKNKLFISDDNITELYTHIKEIIPKCEISLEKKVIKINVFFKSNIDSKFIISFSLKKRVVAQNRLNPLLVEQIQDNKSKIKNLKKQITKLNKAIQVKTDLINELNSNISNINNVINNININNINNTNLNINEEENNNNNNNINRNSDNNENKSNIDIDEDELSKENSSNQEQEVEEKRYISNNRKRKNKKQNKKIKFIQIDNNTTNKNKEDNTIFCFENVEILGNKKFFELLVIFNIITILIILCLLCSIYSIKSDLEYEKMIEEEFKNKLSYLNIVNDYNEDEQPMKKNNNLKKKDTDKNSSKENEKNKLNDELKNTLFESEQQKLNFKKQIIKKKKNKIKDVNFLLKYSSNTDQQSFVKFYNNCKGISDNLILMKNTEGKKYGLFSKNIFDLLNGDKPRDSNLVKNYFAGYSFNSHEFYEFNVKHYFDIYTGFIQSIYNFFSNEDASYQNRYYNISYYNRYNGSQILGHIVEIEIYQVKYIK